MVRFTDGDCAGPQEIATMAKLTDAQTATLTRGAQQTNGFISPAPKTPVPMALHAAKKLEALGLVHEQPCFHDEPWYYRDDATGDCIGYRVTADGFDALGIDASEWPAYAQQDPDAPVDPQDEATAPANEMPKAWEAPPVDDATLDAQEHAALKEDARREDEAELANPVPEDSEGFFGVPEPDASGIEGSVPAGDDTGAQCGENAQDDAQDQGDAEPAQGAPTAAAKPNLKDAATALLIAWDACPSQDATDNPISRAVEALRAALAGKRTATVTRPRLGQEPVLREGTKQQQVIDLLRTEGGATNPAIQEATGWASHTVRGFFAGLKKKGFNVQGTKVDGETVYKIID